MKKLRTIVFGIAIVFLAFGAGYKVGGWRASGISLKDAPIQVIQNTEAPATLSVDFSLFWDVWQRLHRYHIDASHIDTQKLVWGAITGMVNALEDPYTVFLPPKENKEFKEDLGGSFQGIGAQLGVDEGKIIVVAPLKGSPAEKAGIKAGDWIMKVDGEDTSSWSVTQAVTKIRGKKGTGVTLTILHPNLDIPTDISITRDEIIVSSVEYWIKTPGEIKEISEATGAALLPRKEKIAYILLTRFGDRTNEEWEEAVDTVVKAKESKEIRGLILDLRNNPGGYLDGSVFIASEFIKSGLVVTQTNYDDTKQDYFVNRKGLLTDIPMVVIINKGSASASEIVAGALKSFGRAKIIGETSYGKGSVQTPQELTGGAGLHITTGKWLLPKGEWINKIGVSPDVLIPSNGTKTTDWQLEKAIEILLTP